MMNEDSKKGIETATRVLVFVKFDELHPHRSFFFLFHSKNLDKTDSGHTLSVDVKPIQWHAHPHDHIWWNFPPMMNKDLEKLWRQPRAQVFVKI